MSEPIVHLAEVEPGILLMRMQDRSSHNAFSDALVTGLFDAFDSVASNPTAKAVILTGYDSYFTTGGTRKGLLDIHEYEPSSLEKRMEEARKAFKRIDQGEHRESLGETCFAILEFWLGQSDAFTRYSRSRPMTICHGSFHRDQLLFPEDGTKPPWIIDWQNVSTNIGAIDLARIIVSGLLPAQRRQHERRLVALYRTLLREHGVIDYPEQELLDDYRFGLMNVILFHSLILADYPVEVIQKYWSAPEPFWEVLFHNPAEAAKEWDVLGWMKRAIRSSAAGT